MFVTTVRPTTTALQAKFQASDSATGINSRDHFAQRPLAVVVEGRRIIDRHAGRQRTEAGVEVVVTRIDQFQRDHAAAQQVADLLMTADRRANAIAGQQRVAAEQGVAGPFEIGLRLQAAKLETVFREPCLGIATPRPAAADGGTGREWPRCRRSLPRWP